MKASGAPEAGDLVTAKEDVRRELLCVGIVIECRGTECNVLWGSRSNPIGWWRRRNLIVINESV